MGEMEDAETCGIGNEGIWGHFGGTIEPGSHRDSRICLSQSGLVFAREYKPFPPPRSPGGGGPAYLSNERWGNGREKREGGFLNQFLDGLKHRSAE